MECCGRRDGIDLRIQTPLFLGEGRRYQSFIQVNKLGVTVWYRSIGVLGLAVKLQGAVLSWYSLSFSFR